MPGVGARLDGSGTHSDLGPGQIRGVAVTGKPGPDTVRQLTTAEIHHRERIFQRKSLRFQVRNIRNCTVNNIKGS